MIENKWSRKKKIFLKKTEEVIPQFKTTHVLTADQSSFEYETLSMRTPISGEKIALGQVTSWSAAPHSHTIMPILSMDGKLERPVFICLQESSGRLGSWVLQIV